MGVLADVFSQLADDRSEASFERVSQFLQKKRRGSRFNKYSKDTLVLLAEDLLRIGLHDSTSLHSLCAALDSILTVTTLQRKIQARRNRLDRSVGAIVNG